MTPFIDKSCRIKIFDCFVKTVMRNEYRDAAAEKKRIQNREAKPDLMNVPEIEDVYPSEHFILDNKKYPCLIASDWLYDAMLELPKTQRETLILEFWCRIKSENLFVNILCTFISYAQQQKKQHTKPVISPDCMLLEKNRKGSPAQLFAGQNCPFLGG